MNTNNDIILVDEKDNEVGTMEKLEAHRQGKLHRAFSIFVFNSNRELLLQKRAREKYHSGGLWTNTCCSHPRPNEEVIESAHRRLKEEMGMVADLKKIHSFVYKIKFDNGLTEHEYDYVLIGNSDKTPILNPEEAEDFKWIDTVTLRKDLKQNPQNYSYWLGMCFEDILLKIF